jgi:hypothetical protein
MTSNSTKNKIRGRAFQTKLAQMSGGMNIGTLGGEDVMHDEFSYEGKTYKKNCKTNKGKDWKGEILLNKYDGGYSKNALVIIKVRSMEYPTIVMLRWYWWERVTEKVLYYPDISVSTYIEEVTKFKGNTYMNQAESNCPDAKLPAVVVHTVGRRHTEDIVLLREIYWKSLLEKLYNNY